MSRKVFYIFLIILFCSSCSTEGEKNFNFIFESFKSSLPKVEKEKTFDKSQSYFVFKVVDGDTFHCLDENNNKLKIRLIGIDAPETQNRFKKKKGYYGIEAKEYLTDLILEKEVFLEFDVERFDRYDRTLAYVYDENGAFINAELVKNGFARIMTIQPNSLYADLFYQLQQEARENKVGLWEVEEY